MSTQAYSGKRARFDRRTEGSSCCCSRSRSCNTSWNPRSLSLSLFLWNLEFCYSNWTHGYRWSSFPTRREHLRPCRISLCCSWSEFLSTWTSRSGSAGRRCLLDVEARFFEPFESKNIGIRKQFMSFRLLIESNKRRYIFFLFYIFLFYMKNIYWKKFSHKFEFWKSSLFLHFL